jgi:ribosomal protein S18 acetylase RimI-like enzyme
VDTVAISNAETDSDFAEARALFEEYAASLGVDLCFQNFGHELDNMREMYGAPSGCILLARRQDAILGCVALRPFGETVCEMKRLYVRPEERGVNVGRRLAVEILGRARRAGYQRMVLDTLESLKAARALYQSLGFREVEPYYTNPLEGVVYMELEL